MSSFITNLFPSSSNTNRNAESMPPPLQTRNSQLDYYGEQPTTPNRNSFITPISTPQGSPSKKSQPPGAHDLPNVFDNAMKLTPNFYGSPTKGTRGAPLSPGKSNAITTEDSYFPSSGSAHDDTLVHKNAISPGSPLRKQGKENTPPGTRQGMEISHQNQAAVSRHEQYQHRDLQQQTTRKFNTQRGLTVEELEILNKPNVKRLANVTQLCKVDCLEHANSVTDEYV